MHSAKTKGVLSKVSARFKLGKDVEKYPCPDDAKEETCFEAEGTLRSPPMIVKWPICKQKKSSVSMMPADGRGTA